MRVDLGLTDEAHWLAVFAVGRVRRQTYAATIFGHDAALAVTESDLDDNLSLVAAIDRHVDLRLTAAAEGALTTPAHTCAHGPN